MGDPFFIQAPATINLALAVGRADATSGDARHPICSWMVPINLFDDLTLTPLDPGFFSRYAIIWHPDAKRRSEIDWSITKDLAVRAHLLLQRSVGRELPVQLKLEKRIPVAAGLGGGSSDAAAMLRGCNELFGLGLSDSDLAGLAASLGSDVPFFIERRASLVEGFGERSEPVEAPADLALAVFFPDVQCSTAEVYRRFDEVVSQHDPIAPFDVRSSTVRRLARQAARPSAELFNDLLPAALRVRPELEGVIASIESLADRSVHLTGSGSALFVVCDN